MPPTTSRTNPVIAGPSEHILGLSSGPIASLDAAWESNDNRSEVDGSVQVIGDAMTKLPAIIENHRTEIEIACREAGVKSLWLFGSATRPDFRPGGSDVDFLVELASDRSPAQQFFQLYRTLADILASAEYMRQRSDGLSRDRYLAEEDLQVIFERTFEIIGEALARLRKSDPVGRKTSVDKVAEYPVVRWMPTGCARAGGGRGARGAA